MGPIWPPVLKMVDEVANVLVSELATFSITKLSENLSFEDGGCPLLYDRNMCSSSSLQCGVTRGCPHIQDNPKAN